MSIEVRRAGDRAVTRAEGRTTLHSFSFGTHYDPANVALGPLFALNDERLPPGTGYDDHQHASVELLTWVLSGTLRHRDGQGRERLLPAGSVQLQLSGPGIVHAETSADPTVETRFLQSWLRPDDVEEAPSYSATRASDFTVIASGADAPLILGIAGARCHLGDVPPRQEIALPAARRALVMLPRGSVTVGAHRLHEGDELRAEDEPAIRLVAGDEGAAVLAWLFEVDRAEHRLT